MSLTDTAIRNAKPSTKPVRLFDGDGLYLEVSPSGGKLWRMKYRISGKEKRLSFGGYPVVSLREARERRDEAKKLLANDQDPGEVKKAQKAAKEAASANSFEAVAREWFGKWKTDKAASHSSKVIARLQNDVFPWLGDKPIAEITAPMVLDILRRIEGRGTVDTARRAGQNVSQVMRYAIATGRATHDPVPDLRGALPPVKQKHFASLVEPQQVAQLLRDIDAYTGTYPVRAALALAPMLFIRPGELRTARWADIDLDRSEWRFFVTKTKVEHLVPLAHQAVTILRDLYPLTGRGEYVFPGARDHGKSMSNSAINAALRRMGYDTQTDMTGHGFRATARTLLAEELDEKPEVIEHQLAHRVPDTLGTAYNRTKFLAKRRVMMQTWADYLDKLKAGADVIALHPAA